MRNSELLYTHALISYWGQGQAERSRIEQGALFHVLVITYLVITRVPMFIYSQTWSIVIKCIFGACVAAK